MLIESNVRNIFLKNTCRKSDSETGSRILFAFLENKTKKFGQLIEYNMITIL